MKKVVLTASQQASVVAVIVGISVHFPVVGEWLLRLFPGAATLRTFVSDGCLVTAALCRALSPRADGKINGVPLRLVPLKLRRLWGMMQEAYSEQQAEQGGAASDAAAAAALQALPGAKQVAVVSKEAETLVQEAAPMAAVILPVAQEAVSLLPPKNAEEAQAILKDTTSLLQRINGVLSYAGGMAGADTPAGTDTAAQLQKTPVSAIVPMPTAHYDSVQSGNIIPNVTGTGPEVGMVDAENAGDAYAGAVPVPTEGKTVTIMGDKVQLGDIPLGQ